MPKYLCAVSVREIYHLWVEAANPRAAENSLKTTPSRWIRMEGALKDVEQNYVECIDGPDLDAYILPQPVRETREEFTARCEAGRAAMFGPVTEGSELPSYLSAKLLA